MIKRSGRLIVTDVPAKQLIHYLNDQNDKQIIIADLDDTRVFIDSRYMDYVREHVYNMFEVNVFETSDLAK